MNTCTIVYDTENGYHMTLVWEVSEGGASKLTHHHIGGNTDSPEWMYDSAVRLFGEGNVRFYHARVWEPNP